MYEDLKLGKIMLTHFLDGKIGASARQGSSTIIFYRIDDKNALVTDIQNVIKILGYVLSIPCFRLMLKVFMPIFIWLEDVYYYSYHLYDYDEVVQKFLFNFFFMNSEKINPTLGHILDKEYTSKNFKFNTTIYNN